MITDPYADAAAERGVELPPERELPAGDPNRHTCHEGPLCLYYYDEDPESQVVCWHESCDELMREDCLACMADACQAIAERAAADAPLLAGYCPEDGSAITVGAAFGAPGIGHSARCEHGHPYACVGGAFYRPGDMAHIMSPSDVI